jgi:competence protein ComEA
MSRLDVNSASANDLDAVEGLSGHGPEIVRYRGERGGFTDLRQLDEVPGLSGKVSAAVRARLSAGDSVTGESAPGEEG